MSLSLRQILEFATPAIDIARLRSQIPRERCSDKHDNDESISRSVLQCGCWVGEGSDNINVSPNLV